MEFVGKYVIYFHPQLNILRYNDALAVAAKRKLHETLYGSWKLVMVLQQPSQRWTNLEERILEVLKGSHVRIVYGKELESSPLE